MRPGEAAQLTQSTDNEGAGDSKDDLILIRLISRRMARINAV